MTPRFLYCYNRLTQNEIKLYLLINLANFVNSLFVSIIELRKYAIEHGIIASLIQIINDEAFLKKILAYNEGFVGILAFNINWLSKIAEAYKDIWHNFNAISVLINVSKIFPNISLYLFMATANIAYDKEIEGITEINDVIDVFVDLTNRGAKESCGSMIVLKQQFIDEDDNKIYEVNLIDSL